MVRRLHLVSPKIDHELVAALTKLRNDAARGDIIGLAYTALRPGYGFHGDVLGCIAKQRLFCQGLVLELLKLVAGLNGSRH